MNRREEPAIEGRDLEFSSSAAGVRKPRNGQDREPDSAARPAGQKRRDDGVDAVAIAVDGMPHRDKAARLREQEEEYPVQNRERLVEQDERTVADARRQRRDQQLQRAQH